MENSIYVETMTLNELARRFREAGIMTSGKKLADGIEQGKYPFGICIRTNGRRRQFEIYRKLVEKWLEERAV